MRVTRASDYAIRVMIQLATLPKGERQSLPALARSTDVPVSFLAKILKSLSRAGLVLSRRGAIGGFELLPKGHRATMRDVIEAVEGPIVLNTCLASRHACHRRLCCPAHPVWKKAQAALLAVLGTSPIAELAAAQKESASPT